MATSCSASYCLDSSVSVAHAQVFGEEVEERQTGSWQQKAVIPAFKASDEMEEFFEGQPWVWKAEEASTQYLHQSCLSEVRIEGSMNSSLGISTFAVFASIIIKMEETRLKKNLKHSPGKSNIKSPYFNHACSTTFE